jgi:multidrug efflux pump subunit AcrA (membrane-fusion protein)
MKLVLKIAVVLVLLAVLGRVAFVRFWPSEEIAALGEDTVQAEAASMEDVLLVAGLVRPAVTIELRAEASGIVERVSAREGDRVTTGQELVRLDSSLAQSSLEQAEANLLQSELQDAATRLELDEDTLALRRKTYERQQALFERGLIPMEELDRAELEVG